MAERTLIVRGSHGIDLHWVEDGAFKIDGTALYVDNLLDCFASYKSGPLLEHCLKLYRREMQLLSQLPSHEPIAATIRTVWEQNYRLLQGEPEEGLQAMRRAWITDPKATIQRALKMLRKGEKQFEQRS